jgi:hypothetical protein
MPMRFAASRNGASPAAANFMGEEIGEGQSEMIDPALYDRKTPLTAADLLNDRVIPFYDEQDVGLLRVLTAS